MKGWTRLQGAALREGPRRRILTSSATRPIPIEPVGSGFVTPSMLTHTAPDAVRGGRPPNRLEPDALVLPFRSDHAPEMARERAAASGPAEAPPPGRDGHHPREPSL